MSLVRATLLRGAAWCFAAASVLGFGGCSGDEGALVIRRWELRVEGHVARPVELPAHLDDVPARDLEYQLTTRVDLPDELVGRTLELTLPHLPARVTLLANGRSIAPEERHDVASYRRGRPQHFEIPEDLCRDGTLTLELTISHRWTQSAWIDVAPRLAPLSDDPDYWDFVAFVNGPLTLAAVVLAFATGCTWLVVYLGDRRRKAYFGFGTQALAVVIYVAFWVGALHPVFGRYDYAVALLGLTSAVASSLQFTHSFFELTPAPRPLLAVLGAAALGTLVAPGPYHASLFGARLALGSVVLIVTYQLALLSLRLREAHARTDAVWQIVAWLALAATAWVDIAYLLGLGDFADGLRPAVIGITAFGLLLLTFMSRHHTLALSRSDELNVSLQRQVGAVEQLNEELQHQVSDRSEQLFVALAAVATGVRTSLPALGSVLNDRYRIMRTLGEGGMGTVFEVERLRDGVLLAAKFPSESHGIALARLAREAHVASMVVHDNIVRILDVDFLPSGHLYFVMELADGGTLRERHEECRVPRLAAKVLAQVARGLEALHARGLVHRDVKPSNVVFTHTREGLVAKLTDFGISRPSLAGVGRGPPINGQDERNHELAPGWTADGHDGWDDERDHELRTRPTADHHDESDAGGPPPDSTRPGPARRSPHTPAPSDAWVDELEDVTPLLPGVASPSLSASSSRALASGGQVAGALAYTAPELTARPDDWSSPHALTMRGLVAGTPAYMAPELTALPGAFSPSSDIFSFGVLAYQLLVGVDPFVEPPARAVAEGREPSPARPIDDASIPRDLVVLIEACMSFDSENRPTATEAAVALETIARALAVG